MKNRYTLQQVRAAMGNYCTEGDGATIFNDGTRSSDDNSVYFRTTDEAMDYYYATKKKHPDAEVYVMPATAGLNACVTSPMFEQ